MSISGIQGHTLEVTVVGCSKLRDTEWISRQDPYVCVEYASTKFRTRTCTDGGKNPTFQEKFVFPLIEGLREINVLVWNSNTITFDDFIGSGKIQLQKVLSEGFDDSTWPLQTKTGRHAGEVKVIMHYANAKKPTSSYAPSAPPYMNSSVQYSAPPPASYPQPASAPYAPPPPPAVSYPPPPHTAYPSSSHYPSYPSGYPPPPGPPPSYPPPPSTYPPPPYPPPPAAYPPHPYPPPQPASAYYPPGPYPGTYPRPPY
ncbi:protein SRC2 homolog [Neltuma alba]|uniref:protein SRC2 homolog n=1 Tax=Neltuma alba TaxID=207710 RepID=UPI0010A44B6C|nr:protein SRC2 homolog [Prosopis alba]XP_028781153.1 protein SRC2 homolog [Prosopis alba]XP_028798339.1 protein SRC2 homolog [Prosopis alba]XP_028798340.1 protein SRC2 homolog [Prosopis alba]